MCFGNDHLFAFKGCFVLKFQDISRAVYTGKHPVPQVFELCIDRSMNHLVYLLKAYYIRCSFTSAKGIIGGNFAHQYIYICRMQQIVGCNQGTLVIFF